MSSCTLHTHVRWMTDIYKQSLLSVPPLVRLTTLCTPCHCHTQQRARRPDKSLPRPPPSPSYTSSPPANAPEPSTASPTTAPLPPLYPPRLLIPQRLAPPVLLPAWRLIRTGGRVSSLAPSFPLISLCTKKENINVDGGGMGGGVGCIGRWEGGTIWRMVTVTEVVCKSGR